MYVYTPEGRRVGVTTYQEVEVADGLAMDNAGNLLIADHNGGKVEVYSPCGALIKTIRTGTQHAVDVEIGNDGTVLVADYATSKVFMFQPTSNRQRIIAKEKINGSTYLVVKSEA